MEYITLTHNDLNAFAESRDLGKCNYIACIKAVRKLTGYGLKEAKLSMDMLSQMESISLEVDIETRDRRTAEGVSADFDECEALESHGIKISGTGHMTHLKASREKLVEELEALDRQISELALEKLAEG